MRNNTMQKTVQQPLLRTMAISALTLALVACQSTRLSTATPVAQAEIPSTFTAMPEATQAERPSIAAQGYQDFFADERLKKVIAMALEHNRDLRVAAFNVEKVQQQYRIANNGLLPTVGSGFGVTQQGNSNMSSTNYSVNVGITGYELDFWGRVASLKDSALEGYFATQNSKDNVQVQLIGQIAQAWVGLSYAEQNLALAQQTLKIQQDAYVLNEKRFKAGITSELPVRQAQVSVETAKGDVAAYKTQIQQAKNALNLLVGSNVPSNLLPQSAVRKITNNSVLNAGLPSELLNYRPDLQAAEHQLRAAGANITAAKARLYPSITLSSSAGLASTSLSDLFKSGAFAWRIAPSIDLPIFDWGTRKANVKVSETDQKIALANYEKAIQTAFREVNDVLATRANIHDRIAAQRRLVEATNASYKIAQLRFKAGIDNYLSVLSAQQNNYNVEKGLLSLQQAEINSQIELYKALGGGATQPKQLEPEINASPVAQGIIAVQEKLADLGQGNLTNDTEKQTEKTAEQVEMSTSTATTFQVLGTFDYEAYRYTLVEFANAKKLKERDIAELTANISESENANKVEIFKFKDRYVSVIMYELDKPENYAGRDTLTVLGSAENQHSYAYRLFTVDQQSSLSNRKIIGQIRESMPTDSIQDIKIKRVDQRHLALVQHSDGTLKIE